MIDATQRRWLQLEGLAVLVAAVSLYAHSGTRWWIFAVSFLVPDLTFAAYTLGPRIGAYAYNIAHSYILPVLLFACTMLPAPTHHPAWMLPTALIWLAHICWDRMLGYGLKSTRSFDETHLGPIGKLRKQMQADGGLTAGLRK